MKKQICMIVAVLCFGISEPLTVSAVEAGTYEELKAMSAALEAEAFPDPEAKYTLVTEGDFEYRQSAKTPISQRRKFRQKCRSFRSSAA